MLAVNGNEGDGRGDVVGWASRMVNVWNGVGDLGRVNGDGIGWACDGILAAVVVPPLPLRTGVAISSW